MAPPARDADQRADPPVRRPRRSDAAANVERITEAAARTFRRDPSASIGEVAAAAGVSRATIYRHFESRERLTAAVRDAVRSRADANERDELRPAGELADGSTPLNIPDVLNKVPPHLLGDQIVAEAQRLSGASSVALYLVDIDGTLLLRLAGSQEFPAQLPAPLAIGPELPREGLPALRDLIEEELPGSVMAPLLLRGRAIGVLLAVNAPVGPLADLARHAAAALALAGSYTDVFDDTRRRRETSAASEIQQNLLPPRIARIAGGVLAANVLPCYDIGGDWFDYTENADGAWIGVADSMGNGTTAAALGTVALGAFRAKRRVSGTLEETALAIHQTIREVPIEGAHVNVVLARWHGPSSRLRWLTCGHQPPLLISADGEIRELAANVHPALGIGENPTFRVATRRLDAGDRLLLLSDGVLERRTVDGGTFGLDGVRDALVRADTGAAATVLAIEEAIVNASEDLLEDDATVVVFAPSTPRR